MTGLTAAAASGHHPNNPRPGTGGQGVIVEVRPGQGQETVAITPGQNGESGIIVHPGAGQNGVGVVVNPGEGTATGPGRGGTQGQGHNR